MWLIHSASTLTLLNRTPLNRNQEENPFASIVASQVTSNINALNLNSTDRSKPPEDKTTGHRELLNVIQITHETNQERKQATSKQPKSEPTANSTVLKIPLRSDSSIAAYFRTATGERLTIHPVAESGSQICILSQGTWEGTIQQHELQYEHIKPRITTLSGLTNAQVKVVKCIRLPLYITDSKSMPVIFHIVPNRVPVLLGCDFLRDIQANISYIDHIMTKTFKHQPLLNPFNAATEKQPSTQQANNVRWPAEESYQHISQVDQDRLKNLLRSNNCAFLHDSEDLGRCPIGTLKFQLKEGAKPVNVRQFRISPHVEKQAKEHVQKFKHSINTR